MWATLVMVVVGLVGLVGVVGVVFVVGMRRKTPWVLNAVRRLGRAMKGFALKRSGTPGAMASIVRHVGRTSGREYETPVGAVPTDDGFVVALPYGLNTDWLKNVLAAGKATVVHEGGTYEVDRPEMVTDEVGQPFFPPKEQRTHRRFRVDQFLRVRTAAAAQE